MYLSNGAPNHITRLASSRSLLPLEISPYASAPSLGLNYELQFLFFAKNRAGEYKLYSPTVDTIRALLTPLAGTRGLFHPNDIITEADIRTQLTLSPAEGEVVGVARGITGMGNDEILALVNSPERALSGDTRVSARVTSRLITSHPPLTTFQSRSADGLPQVDVTLETRLSGKLSLEVLRGDVTLGQQEVEVHFPSETLVRYEQRLDLLPGEYPLFFTVDGKVHSYRLTVTPDDQAASLAVVEGSASSVGSSPFQFDGNRVNPDAGGTLALLYVPVRAAVSWRLRRGLETVWRATVRSQGVMLQPIGDRTIPPGQYELEAIVNGESRQMPVRIGGKTSPATVISQNANLRPARRAGLIGRQYLANGDLKAARSWFERAWNNDPSDVAKVDLCRVAALSGDYDTARTDLLAIANRDPGNFEAWSVLGYIEAQLQDYPVAARFYQRALALQKSPAIEQVLASLPRSGDIPHLVLDFRLLSILL